MIELKSTNKRAQTWLECHKNRYFCDTIYDAYKKPSQAKIDAYKRICAMANQIDGEYGVDKYHGRYMVVTTKPHIISHNVHNFVTAYCVKKYANGNPFDCYLIVDTKDNTYKIETPSDWLNDNGRYSHVY